MSRKLILFFFLSWILFQGLPFYSAAQVNDAGLWISLSAEKKISSKLSLSLSQEFRFNENISELGTSFTEIGVEYKVYKKLFVGLSYRFLQKRQVDDFYSLRHRVNIDAGYRLKIKKISITLRERFQTQYKDVNSRPEGHLPEYYLRNKLTVKYDLNKKYTPFLSAELFYQLNNPAENEIDNIRYAGGFSYEFNKLHSADLFYLINREVNVNDPWMDYIIGIGYKYSF